MKTYGAKPEDSEDLPQGARFHESHPSSLFLIPVINTIFPIKKNVFMRNLGDFNLAFRRKYFLFGYIPLISCVTLHSLFTFPMPQFSHL